MKYKCPLCLIDPLNHSLSLVLEKEDVLYYYTCASKAKLYFDTVSINNHYNGILSEISENKQWVWIFDGIDFNFNHALQIQVAIELSKLISSKFSEKLKKIIVINPGFYILSIYNIIYPFLNNKMKSILEIDYQSKTVNDITNKI